jgi:hypothetical protein
MWTCPFRGPIRPHFVHEILRFSHLPCVTFTSIRRGKIDVRRLDTGGVESCAASGFPSGEIQSGSRRLSSDVGVRVTRVEPTNVTRGGRAGNHRRILWQAVSGDCALQRDARVGDRFERVLRRARGERGDDSGEPHFADAR